MILQAACCKQHLWQRNSEVRGPFLKNSHRRDSALQHRGKHHPSNGPKSKGKKPNQYSLSSEIQAAILVEHDTCHCQLGKVLDNFQCYLKPKPAPYVLSRHAQIFRYYLCIIFLYIFLPPPVNRSWKDGDNHFI